MLSVIYAVCHIQALCAECHNAERRYAECHIQALYPECHAECHYVQCRCAEHRGTV